MKYLLLFAVFLAGCHSMPNPAPILNQKYFSSEVKRCKLVSEKDLDNEGILISLSPQCQRLTRALAYRYVSEHSAFFEAQP